MVSKYAWYENSGASQALSRKYDLAFEGDMTKTGVIILVHGSRGEKAIVRVPEVLRTIIEGVRTLLCEGVEVVGAALQFNQPTLEGAVASLVQSEITRIVIMPYFLFPGRHIMEDVPQLVKRLECRYQEVQFILASTLGIDELLIGLVAKRIRECMPGLSPSAQISPTYPEDIEQQSLVIVEGLVPDLRSLSQEEQVIVKRIVHASGDPKIAHLVKFSPSAIASGINSILAHSPIVTDVRMVTSGINSNLARTFGCSLDCALDEKNQEYPEQSNITRTAAGIRQLGANLDGALVAIGNAPTALLALLELIDNDGIKPALIVGMPVGFVQARESKEELLKRDLPYITVVGTRGGSAVAAATVNALLKMAVERSGDDRDG